MTRDERFDLVIYDHVERLFPELLADLADHGWLWVKAQIWQESRFDPAAASPVGARGLMQLMPATDRAIDGDLDGADVVGNVDNGVRYLAEQYRHLGEIPDAIDRLRCALASYNGGRGYVNRALELARAAEGLPMAYADWRKGGKRPGRWQRWAVVKTFLASGSCVVNRHRPDHRQMTDYVTRIEQRYNLYCKAAGFDDADGAEQGESPERTA